MIPNRVITCEFDRNIYYLKYFDQIVKKSYYLAILLAIIPMLVIPVLAQETEDKPIPSWVKSVAGYWSEDKINDGEFIEALEFLIDNNVINLGENVFVDNTMSELQEENTILKEKLEVSETNRVSQSQSDAAQHKILYDKKDARYDKLKKDYDERTEKDSQEYQSENQKLYDEIQELKKQLKEK